MQPRWTIKGAVAEVGHLAVEQYGVEDMDHHQVRIGVVGLGVMGRNLALNIADRGYGVAGYDIDAVKVDALQSEAGDLAIVSIKKLNQFIEELAVPRTIIILVPAGPAVESVIRDLLLYLGPGDLIVDGGNSHFKDTDLREKALSEKGIYYTGMGISGGEEGARHGPSLMPGGSKKAYRRIQPILEAVSARVDGESCVTYLGEGSAGHYVKMVHNGIEYGLMQLIAETYDFMKRGLGMNDDEMSDMYRKWNEEEVNAYLLEITDHILRQVDDKTGKRLIDVILDEAKQKGTGKWTSQEAMDLQVPIPTIDAAVSMRNMSMFKKERQSARQLIQGAIDSPILDKQDSLKHLKHALYASMVITFAQGFGLLQRASRVHAYGLKLEEVARIWQAGCIVRAGLLEDVRVAYRLHPDLLNLLGDIQLGPAVWSSQDDLSTIVCQAASIGLPTPCLMASLAYLDSYWSTWLPANLIQAQRDYFWSHTYERVDERGVFHTQWE
jgi:6-phosphogluconate dehydrogenase